MLLMLRLYKKYKGARSHTKKGEKRTAKGKWKMEKTDKKMN